MIVFIAKSIGFYTVLHNLLHVLDVYLKNI